MKIIFMGRGKDAAYILEYLISNNIHISLIITSPHYNQAIGSPEQFEKIANDNNIPFVFDKSKISDENIIKMKDYQADLCVALFWPFKIPEKIINTVNVGFLNLHGGLLPKYRGNACANWAILNGETEMGVTVHFMDPYKLDAGDIVAQEKIPITENTKVKELMEKSITCGSKLIYQVIKKYMSGNPPKLIHQNEDEAMRCYPRLPSYGLIDWNSDVYSIDKHIRSLGEPYQNAYTYFGKEKIEIVEAKIDTEFQNKQICAVPGHVIKLYKDGSIAVATGNGVLRLFKINNNINAREVINSIRVFLGLNMEERIQELQNEIDLINLKLKRLIND